MHCLMEPGLWDRDTSHIDPRGLLRDVVFDVWVANTEARVKGVLEVSFVSVRSGRDVGERRTLDVVVGENGATEVLSDQKGPIAAPADASDNRPLYTSNLDPYVIHVSLRLAGAEDIIGQDVSWPGPFKHLHFTDPGVSVDYEREKGDTAVKLSTRKPVKGFVFAERRRLRLSDNGFDLVPGSEKLVQATGLRKDEELEYLFVGK